MTTIQLQKYQKTFKQSIQKYKNQRSIRKRKWIEENPNKRKRDDIENKKNKKFKEKKKNKYIRDCVTKFQKLNSKYITKYSKFISVESRCRKR